MTLAQYNAQPDDGLAFYVFIGLLLFVAIAGVCLGIGWFRTPEPRPPIGTYAPQWAKRHWIPLTIGLIVSPFWMALVSLSVCAVPLAGIGFALYWSGTKDKRTRLKTLARFPEDPKASFHAWGDSFESRDAAIRDFFERNEGTLQHTEAWGFPDTSDQGQKGTSFVAFRIRRAVASMEPRYRETLRGVELLNNAIDGGLNNYRWLRFGLIYGDGRPLIDDWGYHTWDQQSRGLRDGQSMLAWYAARNDAGPEASLHKLVDMLGEPPLNDRYAKIQAELREVFGDGGATTGGGGGGSGGGNAWLKPADVAKSIFRDRGEGQPALMLGYFNDDTPLTFSGEESLFTIAPPGSGKTQCDVFPNLLTWPGAAVVLDVSGDIYEKTSKWRAENVGPVFKFSPLDPASSHRYSPLSLIRADPMYVWEDSRMLAELMIVPSKSSDPFWENEARNLVAAAIARVAYNQLPESRPMHAVIDVLYGGQPWNDLLTDLSLAVDVRTMMNTGTSLASMNEKTADSVRQTARSSLSAWAGERIGQVTSKSDWSPLDLRRTDRPITVYIVVRPNEVDAYLSLLRVFIGQHIRTLCSVKVPDPNEPRVLFMLDELPRLKHMPPVEEALNIGRKYKLQLWMFAQSFGQMKDSYGENAEGMVGNCGVRTYMNPSLTDGTAEKLADQIGTRKGALDGNRERVVEPHVLAGETFKDCQIVFGTGSKPAKVRKAFAYLEPELVRRMGSV